MTRSISTPEVVCSHMVGVATRYCPVVLPQPYDGGVISMWDGKVVGRLENAGRSETGMHKSSERTSPLPVPCHVQQG